MGTGYVRQSAAEIVDGQVANASDFNNEFEAIKDAFDGTSGHSHDGTVGEGPLIDILTGTSGSFTAARGGLTSTTTAPTATDDTPDYVVGNLWVNTTTDEIFICVDNTSTAAIWQKQQGKSVASAPTVTNDITEGYTIGYLWVDTSTAIDTPYLCLSNVDGAAVWISLSTGRDNNTTSNPTVNDDITLNYLIGSLWTNTAIGLSFICTDNTDTAAVWKPISFGKNNSTGSAPGVTNDIDEGYLPGSVWLNTSSGQLYICSDNSDGAAVWSNQGAAGQVKVDAAAAAGYLIDVLTVGGGSLTDNGDTLDIPSSPLGLTNGGDKTTAFTAVINTKYTVDCTSAVEVTLPAAPSKGDIVVLSKYNSGNITINLNSLKYYGSTTDPTTTAQGIIMLQYTDTATGWIDL